MSIRQMLEQSSTPPVIKSAAWRRDASELINLDELHGGSYRRREVERLVVGGWSLRLWLGFPNDMAFYGSLVCLLFICPSLGYRSMGIRVEVICGPEALSKHESSIQLGEQ